MDSKNYWDVLENVRCIIFAMKKLNLSNKYISSEITKWGYPISFVTVKRIYDKVLEEWSFVSNRSKCGRKPSIGLDTNKTLV